jgi:hypothetical protein
VHHRVQQPRDPLQVGAACCHCCWNMAGGVGGSRGWGPRRGCCATACSHTLCWAAALPRPLPHAPCPSCSLLEPSLLSPPPLPPPDPQIHSPCLDPNRSQRGSGQRMRPTPHPALSRIHLPRPPPPTPAHPNPPSTPAHPPPLQTPAPPPHPRPPPPAPRPRRVDDRRIVTNRPLAGTRRRGATRDEDLALEAELLADQKECAEHVMLVDLGRNDVGKVATAGSVVVGGGAGGGWRALAGACVGPGCRRGHAAGPGGWAHLLGRTCRAGARARACPQHAPALEPGLALPAFMALRHAPAFHAPRASAARGPAPPSHPPRSCPTLPSK